MSQNEYDIRRPMICKAPWSQLTISPHGELTLCTVSKKHGEYIDDFDSLLDFYNGEHINNIRQSFLNKEWPATCITCQHNRADEIPAHIDNNHYTRLPWTDQNFNNTTKQIFALEYTPSSICNRICATCGSEHSSKWYPFDKQAITNGISFRETGGLINIKTPPVSASNKNVQKIIDILPNIQSLSLKGGEPFADPTNIKILNEIIDKNYNIKILIVSNLTDISDEIWDILERLTASKNINLNVMVSIDGHDKIYEWIRDYPYDKLLENVERFVTMRRKKLIVSSAISLYSLGSLKETNNNLFKTGLFSKIIHQYVYVPNYTSYEMIPQEDIDRIVNQFFTTDDIPPNFLGQTERLKRIKYTATINDIQNALQWIDYVNQLRKFNICNYSAYLDEWYSKMSAYCG